MFTNTVKKTFGGFIAPENQKYLENNAFEFTTLRAALAYFLNFLNIKTLHVPVYYCHEVTEFLLSHGIELKFYNIDEKFLPLKVNLNPSEKLLYPDYFGINQRGVEIVLATFGSNNVIVDCAQAFWADYSCLAVLKSYRKFTPVPDGASIITNFELKLDSMERNDAVKFDHLLDPIKESAHKHFLTAEHEFLDPKIKKISKISKMLMSNLDLRNIKKSRSKNFNHLNNLFKVKNLLKFKSKQDSALNYPLLLGDRFLSKKQLHDSGIFVPTYWPKRKDLFYNKFEQALTDNCLFLPIDQRYNLQDLQKMIIELTRMMGDTHE